MYGVLRHAEALGANAILNTRYDDALDVETLFHGAAVVIEPVAPRRPAQLVAGDAIGELTMRVPRTGGTICC